MATSTRLSSAEVGQRGEALYEQNLRHHVETEENIGKIIVIDVETGDYEIDDISIEASKRLHARRPDAPLFGARIGYDVAYHFATAPQRIKR